MKHLKDISQINYPQISQNSKSAHHLFTIWVDKNKRDIILNKFGECNIGTAVNYRSIHMLTYFKKNFHFKRGDFPIAENIGDRTISLPFYISLTPKNVEKIIFNLRKILKQI